MIFVAARSAGGEESYDSAATHSCRRNSERARAEPARVGESIIMERGMKQLPVRCAGIALAAAAALAAPAASAATVFSFTSQAGDSVGLGESKVYTEADSTISLSGDSRHIIVRVEDGSDNWYVSLGAPVDQKFEVRRFLDAENPTRRTGRAPYVYLANNGRRCDDAWGEIRIQQFETDADDNITALEATVLQHCDSATAPVLAAVIRHNVEPLSLKLDGDPGDFVGEGIDKTYYGDTTLFQLWGDAQGAGYTASGSRDRWSAELYPPVGQALHVGTYAIAETADASHAGFRFERPTRRCPQISGGTLELKAVEFDPATGAMTGLHAEFVQRCDGSSEALRGTIRYQA
ncbi:hypothetical protein LA76x_2013 [Lysobacter antibioticus]|uniref:Uncharacterized protein n=2 Tax=Lysobacter antibioticus TaxID=84531 RepID=A0A0S2F9D5_LYSAN|nr:hypothetical protein LA76x_2013 [Lysobacter antibioticus]